MFGRLRAMSSSIRGRSKDYGSPSPQSNMRSIRPGASDSFIREQQFERFRSKRGPIASRSQGPIASYAGGYAAHEEDQSLGSPSYSGDDSDVDDSDDEPWDWGIICRLVFYCTLLILIGFALGVVAEELDWFSWEVAKARAIEIWHQIRAFRLPKEFSAAVGHAGDPNALSNYGNDLDYVGFSDTQTYQRSGLSSQYDQQFDRSDDAW